MLQPSWFQKDLVCRLPSPEATLSTGHSSLTLARIAACFAASRLVLETFFGVELLFTYGECKVLSAIPALQSFIFGHCRISPL
jgi:hypothetical protein